MDLFMLPNRTFTNPSQLMQISSTNEKPQNKISGVLVILNLGVCFNEPVQSSKVMNGCGK